MIKLTAAILVGIAIAYIVGHPFAEKPGAWTGRALA